MTVVAALAVVPTDAPVVVAQAVVPTDAPVVMAQVVAAQPVQQQQQMQVTIPAGVTGGSPFTVNTPAGPMQVVCPPECKGGDTMLVNVPVPVALAGPVPVQSYAQPVTPMSMSREAPPAFDILTVQDGWCGVDGCPLCCFMRLVFNEDKSAITWGPCCCWWLVPVPCVLSNHLRAVAPGSASFKNGGTHYVFDGPDTFKDPNWAGDYKKYC